MRQIYLGCQAPLLLELNSVKLLRWDQWFAYAKRVLKRSLPMSSISFFLLILIVWGKGGISYCRAHYSSQNDTKAEDNPEGYYSFLQAPNANPPTVRPPPYYRSNAPCTGISNPYKAGKTLKNICGDLNKGYIPANPMHQNVLGSPYPFEFLKNKTLQFLSHTLPILQADETIPKVTKYQELNFHHTTFNKDRSNQSRTQRVEQHSDSFTLLKNFLLDNYNKSTRNARKFCEIGGGMFCMLYRAIQGEQLGSGSIERRDDIISENRRTDSTYESPSTPCPAKVEYVTPVFARNYQGIWRYVVQIPYEGYFTQTVEITKCMNTKCHYMDGGCLSSPRWVSLLVAEIYYPDDTTLEESHIPYPLRRPVNGSEPPINKNQHVQKRSGNGEGTSHCDGHDQKGCFQVRLYYDWVLVPGSCKCWRPDYLHKYFN